MRRAPLVALLATVSLLLPASASASGLSTSERILLEEMNRTRAAHGLAPLRLDWTIQRAARAHTRDMIDRGYFGHGSFRLRMERFAVRGPRLAENLAWGAGSRGQARSLVGVWLRSPSHRSNLLRPGFRRVGVAAMSGTFAGRPGATVATADFAGR